jgi:hypothetical protein
MEGISRSLVVSLIFKIVMRFPKARPIDCDVCILYLFWHQYNFYACNNIGSYVVTMCAKQL